MREIALHDTRSGELRALQPRAIPGGSASTPAARPSTAASTSATRGRSSSSACSRASSRTRATRSTLVVNVTDVNDKIYDAAAPPGAAQRASSPREMTAPTAPTPTRSASAARPRAARLRDDRADRRLHRGADRRRPRLRGRRRRLLPRALGPRLRRALAPRLDEHGPGRGRRGRRAQGGPARLRAVEGAQGGRGHVLGGAVGRRAPGLAHRVLGDGRASCSASASTSTAAARTSSSRTTRTRPPRRAPRAARELAADLDAQRDDPVRRREDGQVGRQHRACCTRSLERYGAEARRDVPRLRPLPPAAGLLRGGARAGARRTSARIREAGRRLAAGEPSPAELDAAARALLRRAGATTSTRRGAGGAVRVGARGRPPRRARAGDADLREMLAVLGLESLLDARRARRPRRSASWPSSASRRARSATSPPPTELRDELAALGWEVRDGAQGFELLPL